MMTTLASGDLDFGIWGYIFVVLYVGVPYVATFLMGYWMGKVAGRKEGSGKSCRRKRGGPPSRPPPPPEP